MGKQSDNSYKDVFCPSRIGLGTAQFGMPYGATNLKGILDRETVFAILEKAFQRGVNFLDTAPAYGDSESLLGDIPRSSCFHIGTKTKNPLFSPENIRKDLEHSLQMLRQDSLEILLVHNSCVLRGKDGKKYWKELEKCRSLGLVQKIGFSVYDISEVKELLERYDPQVIQIPLNPLDQRFLIEGMIASMYDLGIEIHARSAFLQGTLLVAPEMLPSFLTQAPFLKWHSFCKIKSWSPIQACLGFTLGVPQIAKVICGVTSLRELDEIIEAAHPLDFRFFAGLHEEDPFIRDPRMWDKR